MRVTTAVATWEGGNDGSDIVALLALCSRVTARLSEERLLVPSSIEIGGWVGRDGNSPPASAHLTLTRNSIEDAYRTFRTGARITAHASSVAIHGTGEIDLPGGERRGVEDLLVVRGALTGDLTVWIETAYDVWLPRGLDGTPQVELHDLNAPRLERSLRALDQQLELGLYGLDGRLAIVRGFRFVIMRTATLRDFLPDHPSTAMAMSL